MNDAVLVVIGALIGSIPSAIGAYVALRKVRPENRNTDANTTKTIVEASGAVIEQLRAEQKRQAAEMARMRLEFKVLEGHVDDLEQLMREAGLTPPPRPVTPWEEP